MVAVKTQCSAKETTNDFMFSNFKINELALNVIIILPISISDWNLIERIFDVNGGRTQKKLRSIRTSQFY